MTRLVVSARVERGPAYDRITVWVRGQNVGTLTVGAGDGEPISYRLCAPPICRVSDPDLQAEVIENESGTWHYYEPAAASAERKPGRDEPEDFAAGIFHRLSGQGPIQCQECGCVCSCECGHVRERSR